MMIHDKLYTSVQIDHPLIQRVVQSRLFLRLQKIGLHGPFLYNNYFKKEKVTLFDHSIGCYFLAKKLNLSISEQLQALLFASRSYGRSIDCFAYLYKNNLNEYNNHVFTSVYEKAFDRIALPYGIKIRHQNALTYEWLCAPWPILTISRLDFILRDYHLFYDEFIDDIIGHIALHEEKLVFTSYQTAQKLAYLNEQLHPLFWGHPHTLLMKKYWDDLISYSTSHQLLQEKHLIMPFDVFCKRLMSLKYPQVRKLVGQFKKCGPQQFVLSDTDKGMKLSKKNFLIDPYVYEKDKLYLLSQRDISYNILLQKSVNPLYITLL